MENTITLRNKRDVELYISLIRLVENNPEARNWCIDAKRAIREYLTQDNTRGNIIRSDYDGYVELVEMPEDITNAEQAEGWFEYHLEKEYVPSAYDCTGQLFTVWHKIFIRRGRYHVYHCVGIDV